MKRGLALIIVIGILGVLAVLAAAFVMMAQLERRASEQRLNGARAYLLARSGVEDALARLELGQDASYGGEDWDGDALLSAYEAAEEVYHRTGAGTPADVGSCPLRHAMRPSFPARGLPGTDPALQKVDGRLRGFSGALAGDYAPRGNTYALKVSPSNARIYINGGALDTLDRDPDGPGADASAFPLNPNAAAEVAPLLPNKVPDHKDTSMEGPNGFLVRLLNNLDAVVTNGATSNLGIQIVEARPVGGYRSLDDLPAQAGPFKSYLTLHAWVDPKVVKPQPMDGRPHRWEDIDDAHRVGPPAGEISGVRISGGGNIQLHTWFSGLGTEANPWTQTIAATNSFEGAVAYPVRWERNAVYAWSQLRLALPVFGPEPRAPLSLNTAVPEALAAAILGLKGAYLEVWEGAAGWDGGFAWYKSLFGSNLDSSYPYPSQATEETPWHRTRVDYGATYRTVEPGKSPPARPWYGPADYDPHAPPMGEGGKPVIQCAPLGRLRETPPLTLAQARAIAQQAHEAVTQVGPARTWARLNAFLDALPRWEDVNDDGMLDGPPYPVAGSPVGGVGDNAVPLLYPRRIYLREDLNSDFIMQRETFTPQPETSWKAGNIAWLDPHLGKAQLPAASAATALLGKGALVPGLTFVQKDVLKAMANPNTDLNDFNPDANLWKEMDKTDLAGIKSDPSSYIHTTELSLDDSAGFYTVRAAGRTTAGGGRLLALRQAGALVKPGDLYRDTTQADFWGYREGGEAPAEIFSGSEAPYPAAGDQALVSYPKPQTVSGGARAAGAAYDGQISLGFIGPQPMVDETLRGDLFGTPDAVLSADLAVPDLRGPLQEPLLHPAGATTGNVFPDGIYSEKDRTLKYRMKDVLDYANPSGKDAFYIGCWTKPNWFPEASPRAHALASVSPSYRGGSFNFYGRPPEGGGFGVSVYGCTPETDILALPEGLYFVPARNNFWQDRMETYNHTPGSTKGHGWPCRSLLWGSPHTFWASDDLNRRGILELPPGTHPVGRLEAHRWVHLAMRGAYDSDAFSRVTMLIVGDKTASLDGGGWNFYSFSTEGVVPFALSPTHSDGTNNHLRFGGIAGEHNMNYVSDATFANVRAGKGAGNQAQAYADAFTGPLSPAVLGRYLKESGAAYASPRLPAGIRPIRITWTEIPCNLWFDKNADGWLGDPAAGAQASDAGLTGAALSVTSLAVFIAAYGVAAVDFSSGGGSMNAGINVGLSYIPLNDRFGAGGTEGPNGKRDVHIALEIWDDRGTDNASDDVRLARFDDPAADNRIPRPRGRMFYKAVFVNEWDPTVRANFPLDVTPFLDDVTITTTDGTGPKILAYETGEAD